MNAKDVAKKVLNKNREPFLPMKIKEEKLCDSMEKFGYLQKVKVIWFDAKVNAFIPTFKLYRKFGR
jgi:hypothetical protein